MGPLIWKPTKMPSHARLQEDASAALPLTYVAYHILLSLANEDRHGYGIIKQVAEDTGGRVDLEAGTLYAAIKRMKDAGWIENAPTQIGEDSRRRTYALTDFGRAVILAESQRLEALVQLARDAQILAATRPAKA
jgi:DNA-binding PadR family transcriptional regulator